MSLFSKLCKNIIFPHYVLELLYKKQKVDYPFFRHCSQEDKNYYINKISSEVLGYNYNFLEPKTFNEKIRWLINYEKLGTKTNLTNKIFVKGFAAKKLGISHSAEIFGVYSDFDEIDFDILPDKFALKANHGWRMNMIINDKQRLKEKDKIKNITEIWLKTNFYYYNLEPQYNSIKPKLFIEYLRPNMNMFKTQRCDVKFHCFNGNVVFVELPFWLNEKKYWLYVTPKFDILEFSILPYSYNDLQKHRPKDWDVMLEYARILCNEFTYVRVDLEHDGNNIHLVEMTFTPYACKMPFVNIKYDYQYGEMLDITKLKEVI